MLYVTTRDNFDAQTAYKTLVSDIAQDGGLYIPFQMPVFEQDELLNLKTRAFSDIVADVLNRFFTAGLSSWSVECAVGRNCLKLKSLGQKIILAEPWHNPKRTYAYLEDSLYSLLCDGKTGVSEKPTNWAKIAIRVAVIFGVYGQLLSDGFLRTDEMFHISVATNDSSDLVAVWYAREMGLPVSMTLCGDFSESGVWDLVSRSSMNPKGLNPALINGLERLIYVVWGPLGVRKLLDSYTQNTPFEINEEWAPLSNDVFSTVVGHDRIATVINSVYRNSGYPVDGAVALPFATVQDYRAKAGENRLTVLFGENDPLLSADLISGATGVSVEDLASAQKK